MNVHISGFTPTPLWKLRCSIVVFIIWVAVIFWIKSSCQTPKVNSSLLYISFSTHKRVLFPVIYKNRSQWPKCQSHECWNWLCVEPMHSFSAGRKIQWHEWMQSNETIGDLGSVWTFHDSSHLQTGARKLFPFVSFIWYQRSKTREKTPA